jgi:hypothetical protein
MLLSELESVVSEQLLVSLPVNELSNTDELNSPVPLTNCVEVGT